MNIFDTLFIMCELRTGSIGRIPCSVILKILILSTSGLEEKRRIRMTKIEEKMEGGEA